MCAVSSVKLQERRRAVRGGTEGTEPSVVRKEDEGVKLGMLR